MTSIIIQFSFLLLNLTRIGSHYDIRISFPYYSNGNKIWEESDWKYLVGGAEGLFFFVPQKDEWESCWYILPQKIDRQWDWHHQKILCEVKSIKSRLQFIFDSVLILFQFSTLARFCSNNKFYWRPPNPRSSWILQRPNSD